MLTITLGGAEMTQLYCSTFHMILEPFCPIPSNSKTKPANIQESTGLFNLHPFNRIILGRITFYKNITTSELLCKSNKTSFIFLRFQLEKKEGNKTHRTNRIFVSVKVTRQPGSVAAAANSQKHLKAFTGDF